MDVSNQMSSYHSSLRQSLKWYRKVAFEIITEMSFVNAHILYNRYFATTPMHTRQFRDSLVLSPGVPDNNIRPGKAATVFHGKSVIYLLTEGDKINKKRKRCRG